MTAHPGYLRMIEEAGGKDSEGWRQASSDLIKQHEALKEVSYKGIHSDPQDQAHLFKSINGQRTWTLPSLVVSTWQHL